MIKVLLDTYSSLYLNFRKKLVFCHNLLRRGSGVPCSQQREEKDGSMSGTWNSTKVGERWVFTK